MENIILIGAGRHCKVVIETIRQNQEYTILGLIDKEEPNEEKEILGIPIIGTDSDLREILADERVSKTLIAIGSTEDNTLRAKLYNKVKNIGYEFINSIHPTSTVASSASWGMGNMIMAKTVLNSAVKIGNNNIINTGVIVEHDVQLGNHIHLAPGVNISGAVKIGSYSHIGTGATVIQEVEIGENCLIGAGAVIIDDIPDNSVVVGNPGQIIRHRGDNNEGN